MNKKKGNKPSWAVPSVAEDHQALRDYYETELFGAEVDSSFTTDTGEVHAEGFSSAEVSKVADLARVLEALVRRPS